MEKRRVALHERPEPRRLAVVAGRASDHAETGIRRLGQPRLSLVASVRGRHQPKKSRVFIGEAGMCTSNGGWHAHKRCRGGGLSHLLPEPPVSLCGDRGQKPPQASEMVLRRGVADTDAGRGSAQAERLDPTLRENRETRPDHRGAQIAVVVGWSAHAQAPVGRIGPRGMAQMARAAEDVSAGNIGFGG